MNEEEKALLLETAELARKNHKILQGMRRDANIGKLISAVKWIVIVGSILLSYSLIQPYLNQLQEMYTSVKGAQQSVSSLQGKMQIDPAQIENLLKSFNVNN
jgi:type II secretory pathway component PulM